MNITEKYKNTFINEYFKRFRSSGVSLKSYVRNSDSFHIYFDNKEFFITNEIELISFLEKELACSKTEIDDAFHYFFYGILPTQNANETLPNNETVLSFEEQFIAKQLEILRKKGLDYNGGATDSLALFKKVGADLNEIFLNPNISTEIKVILVFIETKNIRLKNLLLSGATPNFESLQDTIGDSANYHVLLAKSLTQTKDEKTSHS